MKKVDELLEKAKKLIYVSNKEGKSYLNQAYELALENGYKKGEAWAIMRMGSYALSEGDRYQAIDHYKKSIVILELIDDKQGICRAHFSIGTVYSMMGEYELALNHFSEAKALSLKYDPDYYPKLMVNIAQNYIHLDHYDSAIRMAKHTLDYMKKHHMERLHVPYLTMGDAYLKVGRYKESLACAEEALKHLEAYDDKHNDAIVNVVIAKSYMGLKHFDEALIVFSRALKLGEASGDYQNSSEINRHIAEIYIEKREYDYAFKHLQQAMTMSIKHTSKFDEKEAYFVYSNLYEILGKYQNAYESYKKACQIEKDIASKKVNQSYHVFDDEDYDVDEEKMVLNLDRTLSELRETYLNLSLHEKNELTDAFVEAIVDTIDLRDTTTSGHSKRIAKYSLEMMKRLNEDSDEFLKVEFSDNEMKEMYYAALLHDIGKLAIKESILLKRQRLTHDRMTAIDHKKTYLKSCLENIIHKRSLNEVEVDLMMHLDDYFELIKKANHRQVLDIYTINELKAIHGKTFIDSYGTEVRLIDDFELEHLIVERGNLVHDEWEYMKTHAEKTKDVLEYIPWLSGMKNVPLLASSHHEKIDGSGYPLGLKEDEVTIQMRILSIVDIFEALTASDRPYKAPLTIEEAISVLKLEAESGKLDTRLVEFFINKDICNICKDEIEDKS